MYIIQWRLFKRRQLRKLAVLLACLIALSPVFAGGSQENTTAAEVPAEANGNFSGTITFVSSATQGNGIKAVFEEYQKTHPDVQLDLVPYSTVTDFETMMTGYIAAGTMPDMYLAQVGATQQEYAANGYLLPLPQEGIMENVVDGDPELIMYDGEYFAFPMNLEISSILVNNAAAKEAGIVLDENNYPRCWSEFIELLDQFVAAGIQYPVAVAGKDSSSVTAWPFQYIYQSIYGEDPNWYANVLRGTRAWNDELYLEMFNKYDQMRKYIAPSALGNDVNGMYRSFISGESPVFFQVMHTVGTLRGIGPDLDIICLPSCFNDDPAKQTIISGYGDGVSICTATKNPELCLDFMRYLTSEEGSTIYTENAGSIPSTKKNNADVDPAYSICLGILQNGTLPTSTQLSRQWIPGVKEIMKTAQQNWFAGADAQTVCDEIQAQHERLVEANPEWVQNFLDTYVDK